MDRFCRPVRTLMCLLVASLTVAARAADSPPSIVFVDACGTCQGGIDSVPALADAVGWDRWDLSWQGYEPHPGERHPEVFKEYGKRVLAYAACGKHLLPMLGYAAGWATDRNATYVVGDRKFVHVTRGGKALLQTWRRGAGGTWTKASESAADVTKSPILERSAADWEHFVRNAVTFLHAPPYNVEYFQIWNEAHPDSGFWSGDLDTYMKRIHLPAARVIHELGCKVVYGGWPCCGNPRDLISLLDRNKAWGSLDVIDCHYFGVDTCDLLRRAAVARGYDLGVWETEVGFTTDPGFVADTYPRFIHWALGNSPAPDKYKMFFFPWWSPNDPKAYGYRTGLITGNHGRLTPHGQSMRLLGELLGRKPLTRYEGATSIPALTARLQPRSDSLEAFRVGDHRLVVALHVGGSKRRSDVSHAARTALRLDLAGLAPDRIASVERRDQLGARDALTATPSAGGGSCVVVPLEAADKALPAGNAKKPRSRTFFVVIELVHGTAPGM